MRRSRRHKLVTLTILFFAYYAANALKLNHTSITTSTTTNTTSPATPSSDRPSKDTQTTTRSGEEILSTPAGDTSTQNSSKGFDELKTTVAALTPGHPTWRPKRDNCTPPAIEQFPRPLMGPWGRRHGGLVIHFLVAIFTFIGLAIVCDDYFVAALDRICEELKMSPDVAGATFMAAGSSAPELATVVIGVFFAKDDIGTSGVIGSAVFNIMFVISVCALCAGTVSHLNWWPLCRDCFFYALSILIMLAIISNDVISWPEALFMLLTYVVYCVALHFNSALERWALSLNLPFKLPTREEQAALVTYKSITKDKPAGVIKDGPGQDNYASMDGDNGAGESPEGNRSAQGYNAAGYDNAAYNADINQAWDPNQSWGDNTQGATTEAEAPVWDPNSSWGQQPQPRPQQPTVPATAGTPAATAAAAAPAQQLAIQPQSKDQNYYRPKEYNPETAINPLVKPPVDTNLLMLVWWYIVYPIHWTCRMTMPDCRSEKYRNWYPFTFCVSMIWISFYSYFMVWMITIIGSTLGIPDTVMGLTFVAAGVSVPDALSSLAVIKEGYGDMAVSNAVGSNVFDILVCLGLPWFIQTAIIKPGSHVNVISKGLTYTTMSLLSTVVFLILATHLNGWKLDRKYGIILMIWYLLFITFAALYELNVFGELNKPECPSLF